MNAQVAVMAILRLLFGVISLTGGFLMFRGNDLQHAIRINSIIGSIGPLVFLAVSVIGLAGVATQMDSKKLVILLAGIALIMWGTR